MLGVQNIGGLASDRRTFTTDYSVKDPNKFTAVGDFHTHPYDKADGSYNGVSFSGADVAEVINGRYAISVVQSGPRLFALVRTAQAPRIVDHDELKNEQLALRNAEMKRGVPFPQAIRLSVARQAAKYHLAYYQGSNGVLTRVVPNKLEARVTLALAVGFMAFSKSAPATPIDSRPCHSAIQRTLPSLASADKALARRDSRAANNMLDFALRSFGRSDFRPGVHDDTELYLGVADIQQRQGQLKLAASNKRDILLDKLHRCGYKSNSSPATSPAR